MEFLEAKTKQKQNKTKQNKTKQNKIKTNKRTEIKESKKLYQPARQKKKKKKNQPDPRLWWGN